MLLLSITFEMTYALMPYSGRLQTELFQLLLELCGNTGFLTTSTANDYVDESSCVGFSHKVIKG